MEPEKVTVNNTNTSDDLNITDETKVVIDVDVPTMKEIQIAEVSMKEDTVNQTDDNNTCIETIKIEDDSVEAPEKSTEVPVCDIEKEEKPVSSLGIIALEYDDSSSDSEESSNPLVTEPTNSDGKEIEMEMHSYRVKQASSSDDSDSEDDSTDSVCSVPPITNLSDDDSDSSITKNGKAKNNGKNVKELKNEWDDLPPIEDLKISVPEVLCEPLGQVAWMVEQIVVVEPKPGKPTLNLDTVLFVEKGKRALGKIFDVFGQVNEPHYCVRFNTTEHIKESDIKVGMTVYFCPSSEYTSLVFLHELMKLKGSDAVGDDEPPEFSDDEEERLYYEQQRKQQQNKATDTAVPCKRSRTSNKTGSPMGWQTKNPWNRNPQHNNRQNKGRGRQQWLRGESQWPANNYVFGAYTQNNYPMQYPSYSAPHMNPSFAAPQHNYQGGGGPGIFPGPRPPYNVCPRYPTSFPQGDPSNLPHPNLRFRPPNVDWTSPSQFDNANATWASLPPPPPPPPPPNEGS